MIHHALKLVGLSAFTALLSTAPAQAHTLM